MGEIAQAEFRRECVHFISPQSIAERLARGAHRMLEIGERNHSPRM